MAIYKVIVRKAVVYETEVLVRTQGYRKAQDMAVAETRARPGNIKWVNTEVDEVQPYAVSSNQVHLSAKGQEGVIDG